MPSGYGEQSAFLPSSTLSTSVTGPYMPSTMGTDSPSSAPLKPLGLRMQEAAPKVTAPAQANTGDHTRSSIVSDTSLPRQLANKDFEDIVDAASAREAKDVVLATIPTRTSRPQELVMSTRARNQLSDMEKAAVAKTYNLVEYLGCSGLSATITPEAILTDMFAAAYPVYLRVTLFDSMTKTHDSYESLAAATKHGPYTSRKVGLAAEDKKAGADGDAASSRARDEAELDAYLAELVREYISLLLRDEPLTMDEEYDVSDEGKFFPLHMRMEAVMDTLCTVWYNCSAGSALPEDECSKINDPATGGYQNKHMSHLVTDTRDTVLGFMAGLTREYESFTIDPSTTNVGAASSVTGRLSILSRAKVFSKCPVITMANVYNVISALELESKLVVEKVVGGQVDTPAMHMLHLARCAPSTASGPAGAGLGVPTNYAYFFMRLQEHFEGRVSAASLTIAISDYEALVRLPDESAAATVSRLQRTMLDLLDSSRSCSTDVVSSQMREGFRPWVIAVNAVSSSQDDNGQERSMDEQNVVQSYVSQMAAGIRALDENVDFQAQCLDSRLYNYFNEMHHLACALDQALEMNRERFGRIKKKTKSRDAPRRRKSETKISYAHAAELEEDEATATSSHTRQWKQSGNAGKSTDSYPCAYCGGTDVIPGTNQIHSTKSCLPKLLDYMNHQAGQNAQQSWHDNEKRRGRPRPAPTSRGVPFPESACRACTPERFSALKDDRSLTTIPKADLYPGKAKRKGTTETHRAQSAKLTALEKECERLQGLLDEKETDEGDEDDSEISDDDE